MCDEELFLDAEKVKEILESSTNFWREGSYKGERWAVVEAGDGDKLEEILHSAFPKYESNDIISDAFKEIGINDYGFSDQFTFCSNCNNIFEQMGYPPDDFFVGDGEIACTECVECDLPELVALHKAIGTWYRDMTIQNYNYIKVVEVKTWEDDPETITYVIGNEDDIADEREREEYINKESIPIKEIEIDNTIYYIFRLD